ncbi:hypothetical protein [Pseudomonas syringae]
MLVFIVFNSIGLLLKNIKIHRKGSAAAGLAVKRGAPVQTAVPSDGLLAVTGGFFE